MFQPDSGQRQQHARLLRQASRSKFRRVQSLDLIPEHPRSSPSSKEEPASIPAPVSSAAAWRRQPRSRLSLWYYMPDFVFLVPKLLQYLLVRIIYGIFYVPFSIAAPGFWLAVLLWLFWKLTRIPFNMVRWLVSTDAFATTAGTSNKDRRTVLLSSGSTIQTLHLARNFHGSGARVVVFEFDGLFGLSRFSIAVDKFYVVPRPTGGNADKYIAALCEIVKMEKPSVYVPVCATSPAHFDALAKPHLELLGCATFIPGVKESAVLDDVLQLYEKCAAQNIPLPPHTVLSSPDDLNRMYENGFISSFRNILMAVGMQGILERYKYVLPTRLRDLKFNHEISERQPWLVVHDQPTYQHFITCTTVKDSRVVSNLTCRVDHHTKNLFLVRRRSQPSEQSAPAITASAAATATATDEDADIENWLHAFFAKVRFQRGINGHISFRLMKCQETGQYLPLSARLGVSLPYIAYNRSHAQMLCHGMRCIHRQQFSLTLRNQADESVLASLTKGWSAAEERAEPDEALDKRDALFAYSDPLPYCAYYHFQLPLESVKLFLEKRQPPGKKNLTQRITAPLMSTE